MARYHRLALISLIFATSHTYAGDITKCIINAFRAETIGNQYKESDRDIYFYLHYFDYGFSKNKKIQDRAFQLFAGHESPWDVIDQFFHRDPAALQRALDQLEKMPELAKSEILREAERAQLFWSEIDPPNSAQDIFSPVLYNGNHYRADLLKQATSIRDELAAKGVETEILPGKTFQNSSNGQAIVKIVHVKETASPTRARSGQSIFKSSELNSYLAKTKEENGVIFIDPNLTTSNPKTAAYFYHGPRTPGTKWSIGVKPSTIWSVFIHEWEHKLDFVDRNKQFPDAVYNKTNQNNAPKGALKRTANRAGEILESRFISELNATGAQFGFYFKSASAPLYDVINTTIYRASNQRKVAIGRILQDPLNPKHYILYVGSRAIQYGAIPVLAATPAIASVAILSAIIKTEDANDRHRDEQSWKELRCDRFLSRDAANTPCIQLDMTLHKYKR